MSEQKYIRIEDIPYYLQTGEDCPMEGRKVTFKADIDCLPTYTPADILAGMFVAASEPPIIKNGCTTSEEVFAYDELLGWYKAIYCYDDEVGDYFWATRERSWLGFSELEHVTHWIPLPATPKEATP